MIAKKIASICKFIAGQLYAAIFGKKLLDEDIWIISEKKTEARDNGYYFYKFLRSEHPEINSYYVITKNSADRKKVLELGPVIDYGSFKHCVYYAVAKVRACSQVHGVIPYDDIVGLRHIKLFIRKDQKQVNLKHGISKDFRPDSFDFRKVGFDLYVAGAKREYDEIRRLYNYPEKNIALTGFCRFDALHELPKPEKTILVMPTFRSWLKTSDSSKAVATDEEMDRFKKSNYYQTYKELLTDRLFLGIVNKYGYKVLFYLHYTFQPYTKAFDDLNSDIVVICKRNEYDVQKLLISSSMLITDYSSVFFDYGYMMKPMVFYQFDLEEYRKKHYQEGYFSYEQDDFGPIMKSREEITEYMDYLFSQGMNMDAKYRKRAEAFFVPFDNHNSERVYNATLRLFEA